MDLGFSTALPAVAGHQEGRRSEDCTKQCEVCVEKCQWRKIKEQAQFHLKVVRRDIYWSERFEVPKAYSCILGYRGCAAQGLRVHLGS